MVSRLVDNFVTRTLFSEKEDYSRKNHLIVTEYSFLGLQKKVE